MGMGTCTEEWGASKGLGWLLQKAEGMCDGAGDRLGGVTPADAGTVGPPSQTPRWRVACSFCET